MEIGLGPKKSGSQPKNDLNWFQPVSSPRPRQQSSNQGALW